MPTNAKVKTFATGVGSYTGMGVQQWVATQASSASANYKLSLGFVAPYVSGILQGWSIGQKQIQGTDEYGIVRSVYLTTITTMSGTGASGAGATAKLLLYRAGVVVTNAVASLAFNTGVDATALTPKLITLSTTKNDLKVRWNDLLVFQWLQGATGLALPEALVSVDLI
jgi:hypothetical protein